MLQRNDGGEIADIKWLRKLNLDSASCCLRLTQRVQTTGASIIQIDFGRCDFILRPLLQIFHELSDILGCPYARELPGSPFGRDSVCDSLWSLHTRCRRSIGPFVYYHYQEDGQWWEGFELWVGLRGDIRVIYGEDWAVCEICAPGCIVFRRFVEHQVGAVVVAVIGEIKPFDIM
jgi:hypothetical protein